MAATIAVTGSAANEVARGTGRVLSQEVPGRHAQHVARALRELPNRAGLEARVHRAVLAAPILARLPVGPVGLGPELAPVGGEGLADQVAGPLPAARREGDRAPGRAVVVALARGELQVHRRRAQRKFLRQLQHALELLLNLLLRQEDVL